MNMNKMLLVTILIFGNCLYSAQAKVVVALSPLVSSVNLDGSESAVSDIMQAELSQSSTITLVDRQQLNQALKELKLSQQGMVSAGAARDLGNIVGARYFCSGFLKKSGDKTMATVKVIEIETTLIKMTYGFIESKDDVIAVGKTLAAKTEKLIGEFEKERIQREKDADAKSAEQTAKIIPDNWKRPTVMVIIREMHVRQPQLIDPAGETEITKRLIADNFKIIDSEYVHLMKSNQLLAKKRFQNLKTSTQYAAKKGVDILLYGEAVSEYAAGLGDFEGCRARIELKAIDVKTDRVILADSAHGGATDLAETVAGKKAIQQAANHLADTFLYELAEKWNKDK